MATCWFVIERRNGREELAQVYSYDGTDVVRVQVGRTLGSAPDEATANQLIQRNLEALDATLAKTLAGLERFAISKRIERHEVAVGTYHPGIARPLYPGPPPTDIVNPIFRNELEQLAVIKREIRLLGHDLEECFNVSAPNQKNFDVFGIRYESMLIFACIGVEALFTKVLRENGCEQPRYSTGDFVKLLAPMQLDQYEVRLARYPGLPSFAPFKGWTTTHSTKSLRWYDAYNKIKHDKSASVQEATMHTAINAWLAYRILVHAVFGTAAAKFGFVQSEREDDLHFLKRPTWSFDQFYLCDPTGNWSARRVDI
jgi:hypothetical protein